jgi:hypothetical protein
MKFQTVCKYNLCLVKIQSHDSSVGKVTQVQFRAVQDFSLLHGIQADSGDHPASYPMGTGGFFPGG